MEFDGHFIFERKVGMTESRVSYDRILKAFIGRTDNERFDDDFALYCIRKLLKMKKKKKKAASAKSVLVNDKHAVYRSLTL